jgi:zinc-binding alcohol dehydrogenase/oxidoreductase
LSVQAVRVHEGGALRYEQADDPVAGPGEVLVELTAAAMNRRDLLVRNPPGPAYTFPMPFVAGHDGAGIRRDTGEEVVLYPAVGWGERDDVPDPGMRFLGGPLDGTFAELIAVPAENAFPKPARLSFEEAASLPVAGLTAYRALLLVGRLAAGETALVLGAGSGVSTFAVSLAAQVGARVLVTSSSEAKIERVGELGADGGVLYTQEGWAEGVRELTGGAGVDLVLDAVGSTWPDSLRCLRRGGRLVVMGGTGGARAGGLGGAGGGAGRSGRAFCLPQLALHPGHDAWLAAPVRHLPGDGAGGELAADDRWRPLAGRGRVGLRAPPGRSHGKARPRSVGTLRGPG